MRSIRKNRQMAAPLDSVWKVLSDYPNICEWNSGVKVSHSTNELSEGVGAKRHCGLKPFGSLEETVLEWGPPSKLVISIDSVAKMPIRNGKVTFTLVERDGGCYVEVVYLYWTQYGPIGWLAIPMLNMLLRNGFSQFLKDLETAAKEIES